jgi:hypothetical protein
LKAYLVQGTRPKGPEKGNISQTSSDSDFATSDEDEALVDDGVRALVFP